MRREFFEVRAFAVIFNYNSEFIMLWAKNIAYVMVKYGVQNP